jgi:hypothetical protein
MSASVRDNSAKLVKADSSDSARSPDSLIVIIAGLVDSLGHVSDTARLKAVSFYMELKAASVRWFDGRAYYQMQDPLNNVRHWNHHDWFEQEQPIDTSGKNDIRDAWGYFYRNTIAPKNVSDGAILVWRMSSPEAARGWLEVFRNGYPLPYFNTMPHYMVVDDRLIIVNARTMIFSYEQVKMYKLMLSRFRPSSHFTAAKL